MGNIDGWRRIIIHDHSCNSFSHIACFVHSDIPGKINSGCAAPGGCSQSKAVQRHFHIVVAFKLHCCNRGSGANSPITLILCTGTSGSIVNPAETTIKGVNEKRRIFIPPVPIFFTMRNRDNGRRHVCNHCFHKGRGRITSSVCGHISDLIFARDGSPVSRR